MKAVEKPLKTFVVKENKILSIIITPLTHACRNEGQHKELQLITTTIHQLDKQSQEPTAKHQSSGQANKHNATATGTARENRDQHKGQEQEERKLGGNFR